MKTIKFVREDYRNGKLVKKQTICCWNNFKPSTIQAICLNFYEGFCMGFDKPYRRPINPSRDGFEIWSYNFHKDKTGFIYRIVNGKNKTIKVKC